VDGQENSGTLFIAQRYAEVNSYYSITQHIYSPEPLIMSTSGFGALSPEHQAVMLKAAAEAGDYQRKLSIEMEGKELDTIIAGGTQVNTVDDISLFQRAVQPVYDSFEADFGPLIRKIQAAQR
jgi:TRAP-type C4-dicarboxylate transport system substrate-binding protein